MDKKQSLITIVKDAHLPEKAEKILLDDINSQKELSDAFILEVADTLDRLSILFRTIGESQQEYIDSVLDEAQNANNAIQVLKNIDQSLSEEGGSAVSAPSVSPQSSRDELQVLTGTGAPAK